MTLTSDREAVVYPKHLLPLYRRRNVLFEYGNGSYLYDVNGKEYLDFSTGIGVNILGHNHKLLHDVLQKQMLRPWHVSNGYRSLESEALAEKLVNKLGYHEVFFCNSGTEATECVIKTIRSHNSLGRDKVSENPEIIIFSGSFHGRGWGGMASSDHRNDGYHIFRPALGGFVMADANAESLLSVLSEDTVGVLLEPIQGHAGAVEMPSDFLLFLRRICDERNILLCFDCIQSGYGRTGDMFAYELSGAKPDVISVAKGMCGGLPMGACIFNKKAALLGRGQHGSTCGGNPLCCGVASFVFDEVAGLLDNVRAMSARLRGGLDSIANKYPSLIVEIRGRGLMLGVAINQNIVTSFDSTCALIERGLLTIPSDGNSLRLLPPYNILESDIERFYDILDQWCKDTQSQSM